MMEWPAHTHLNRGLSQDFDTPLYNCLCTLLCVCLECMCLCKCTMLSCISFLLIMLNPRDDTLNPLCQPGPLQQHSGKELGLALAHCLHTQAHTHTCQVTPKWVTKRRKHFCMARKANKYPTSVYVCENVREKEERE